MAKQKLPSIQQQEEHIFQSAEDLQRAFIHLYVLYAPHVYRYCYVGLYHHQELAEQITANVFKRAFQYFHSFTPGSVTYRSYLFSLAAQQVIQRRVELKAEHKDRIRMSRKFSKAEREAYHWVQRLEPVTFSIAELWYGQGLTAKDIALAVKFDEREVLRRHTETRQTLQATYGLPNDAVATLYEKRNAVVRFSGRQERTILDKVLKARRSMPSFVQRRWWRELVGPIPFTFALTTAAVVLGLLWYVERPAPLVEEPVGPTVNDAVIGPVVQQRPAQPVQEGGLPDVIETRLSLTDSEGNKYGTDYVVTRDNATDNQDELRPNIELGLPVQEYRQIASMYTYATPEALGEEDLQLQAFRHFSSLPLNKFTYVNGTYYMEDPDGEFQPLFIAFNADGAVEYQMRQAAICALDGLTDGISGEDARAEALAFLRSHNFVEVDDDNVLVERVSEAGRTTTKGAFCEDDDDTPVQDREYVIYTPHTLIRYGAAAEELVPMRFRGIAVQLHGNTVTNVRIDPLFTLQDKIVRNAEIDLIPVEEAATLVEEFYYPASEDVAEYARYQRVYAQWNHQYGEERLQDITITDLAIEYVFDALNKTVEPYYVFSGTGIDAVAEDPDVRMYVAASSEDVELRGPYRE